MRDEIQITGRPPSVEQLVLEEMINIIEVHDQLSQVFKTNFKPNANQRRIMDVINTCQLDEGEPLHILLFGGVGSGKTWGAMAYCLDVCLSFPGVNMLSCRRTSLDLKTTVFQEVEGFLGRYGVNYSSNANDLIIRMPNTSKVFMRSDKALVQAKKSKSDALGGTFFSVVLLEEVDSISEELVDTIPGRMRQRIPGFRKVIFYLCNPPSKNHWIYRKFFGPGVDADDPASSHRAIHCPMEGNQEHLDPGYVSSVTKEYAKNPSLYARLRQGNFAADTKGIPYYAKEFNKKLHVAEESLAPFWNPKFPMCRGWDFGYRGQGLVVFQDDLERRQIRVFYSFLEQNMHLHPFADELLKFLWTKFPGARWRDFPDPNGDQKSSQSELTNFDILRGLGCELEWEKTSLSYGLSLVAHELKQVTTMRDQYMEQIVVPGMLFSPDAEILIEAYEAGYCNEKDSGSDEKPMPVKDGYYDHIADAHRYGMVMIRDLENPVRKQQLEDIQRRVANRSGWQAYEATDDSRTSYRPATVRRAGPRASAFGRTNY